MKNHFMRTTRRIFIFIFNAIILFFASTACVSVDVPFGPAPKASGAVVEKPDSPFVTLTTTTADEAWISERTGNTISYLSECKKNEQKIEDIAKDTAAAIDNVRILKKSSGKVDGHNSAELLTIGKLDDHKVKMAISVFKAGKCTFSITYGGLDSNFESELPQFESFKKGFKVP